jgi:UDP-N-acetylglucosamine 2-epimerase (non-hydrolysing)
VDDKQNLKNILTALKEVAQRIPIVFLVHPRTRKNIDSFGLGGFFQDVAIRLIEPLGYINFLNLEMNSRFVITDSGGIQVETTVLGIPCLTLLDSPVWLITHKQGTNILVGQDGKRIAREAFKVLEGEGKKGRCSELWDGKTAERIVEILAHAQRSEVENL